MIKQCYKCGWKLPLFLFQKDRRKFQLKTAKGKVHECRFCTASRYNEGKVSRYNFETKKFELIEIKPTILTWIKLFMGWKMN